MKPYPYNTISNFDDTIDVRDIIGRVEGLETESIGPRAEPEYPEELPTLRALLDELKGYGGDEQWQGDWYPVTLIRDSYFKEYAQQLADDIGAIDANAGWPMSCIDWDQAARELRMDYSSVEFGGVTYWYR
jgi:hypothetical protein